MLILIVEDNEKNLRLARDVLEFAGFTTLEARTAEEGLVLAREHQPDAILMDLQLPGMDGVTALHALRQDGRTRSIPVAAVTAFAMNNDWKKLLAEGFDGYFSKPIEIDHLAKDVLALCEGGKLQVE